MALSLIYNTNKAGLKIRQYVFEYLCILLTAIPVLTLINFYCNAGASPMFHIPGDFMTVCYEAFISTLGAQPVESK